MGEMFFKNINTGVVLSNEEYFENVEKSAQDLWENMSDEEKEEDWNNSYGLFYNCFLAEDTDFKIVDKSGNNYWD